MSRGLKPHLKTIMNKIFSKLLSSVIPERGCRESIKACHSCANRNPEVNLKAGSQPTTSGMTTQKNHTLSFRNCSVRNQNKPVIASEGTRQPAKGSVAGE